MTIKKINIQPGVSVLAVLRYLNYKPWFALSEFVDNAIQSFISHRQELEKLHGGGTKLKVHIEVDATLPRITIRDNATGIFSSEYARAFRPAAIPPDRSGLCEFGMGMKSAACWFTPKWVVRTSALGENVSRTVRFDIVNIVRDDIKELEIKEQPEDTNAHYTEIALERLFHPPVKKTVAKLKEHLADIYRVFIRDGVLELRFNGELLEYKEPSILNAPYYKDKEGQAIVWRKEIDFDFGKGQRVYGFAALRETASTSRAGFSLFRRNRLIQGSSEEGYRPEVIFGQANSYRYQRLFGELHLEGFEVTHTKDGFRWEEYEDEFLSLLKEHLNADPQPLLSQAEGYRVKPKRDYMKQVAEKAVRETAEAIQAMAAEAMELASSAATATEEPLDRNLRSASLVARQEVREVYWRSKRWHITIDLSDDPAIGDWLTLTGDLESEASGQIGIRLSLAHPFMVRFEGASGESIEALLRIACAIALSEVAARASGVRGASAIKRSINEILRDCLSSP